MKPVITALILACPAFATEVALLSDGSRIHAEMHESIGNMIRFKTAKGDLQVPAGSIKRFEIVADISLPEPAAVNFATKPVDPHALIRDAAKKHGVQAPLIKSIVAAESNFDCDAVSPRGAVGLMQLMPSTAQEYGVDPAVPEQNIDGGTRYLRFLINKYRKYRDWLARVIAAYNAGPGAVDRYRGVPPFRETREYVTRVLSFLHRFRRERGEREFTELSAKDIQEVHTVLR